MANILVVPVCPHVDAVEVVEALAAALPEAAVFNVLENAAEAERLIAAGEADDWLDLLIGRAAQVGAKNRGIQGVTPDAERVFMAAQNVDLATSFNARVVFAAAEEGGLDRRLKLAKQIFNGKNVELAGVIGCGAEAAKEAGLPYLGKVGVLEGSAKLVEPQAEKMSPAQFRFNMMESARKANKRIVLPEGAEPRTVQAAAICHEKGIARCVLLAPRPAVMAVAENMGIELPDSV